MPPTELAPRLLSWASILEPKTREQAVMTASMPFIQPHMALMPDAHLGKGATVGSVIPTVGAIIPAAVGVDIGCVDAETEYLSPTGWRRIDSYVEGPVMQYDHETGRGSFVPPSRYVVRDQDTFLRFETKYGVDQVLTPDHRVLRWRRYGRARELVGEVVTAAEHAAEHGRLAQGSKAVFETAFEVELPPYLRIDLNDAQLRVQVAVMADAHLDGRRAVVKLRKVRKVDRLRKLLDDAGIEFSEGFNINDSTTTFRFSPPMLAKSYEPAFWSCSLDQLRVVVEECLHWDGNEADRVFYTRDRASADFISYAFAATGWRSVMRADERDGAVDYRVYAHANTRISMSGTPKGEVVEVPSVDGKAYCFTVPSGFLVLRRGGKVFITGNCGMQAVLTQFTKDDLGDRDLAPLHAAISRAVPLSAGAANQKLTESAERRVQELKDLPGYVQAHYALERWPLQLGSLGSGNHFIEVSLDELDRIWLFLHSGSRGVGNKLAQRHIAVAQEQCARRWVQLPDRDLAYLVEGEPEFDAYIEALRWAQHFALLNRAEMMDRVAACASEFLGAEVQRLQEVGCHHNYTERERHMGKDVWLSRKGAISAKAGEWGLIPGSMGAASYVVVGKGDRASLCSSPHGAGRNHSRAAARRLFDGEDLARRMQGVAWGRSDAFLDEHPEAYKDIDVVMADADDLVEVRHTLRQVVNVKGT
jgi:tRNA-splicing ligase RtcB (3'-phosphate/5'-hydroxy nucleic acid ligase)